MEEAPQAIDYFIQIPEFALRLLPLVLDLPEFKVFFVLYERSWGQGRPECRIALQDIAHLAKLATSTTFVAVRGLKQKNLITAQKSRNPSQPLSYLVSRDGRDYRGPLPEELRPEIYKPSAADKRIVAAFSKEPTPVEQQLDLLKKALFEKTYATWLEECRIQAPNMLVERLLKSGVEPDNRILRDFFTTVVFEPYLKSLLEGQS